MGLATTGGAALDGDGGSRTTTTTSTGTAPSFITVLGLLLLPFVLISFNTVLATLDTAEIIDGGATWAESLMLLGDTTTVLSHVNDSGFWLVSRFFEMDE